MRIEAMAKGKKLTQTDQAIVAFIAQNTEQVLTMSVRELAEASFTSPAAVVRLCRRLGVESFGDLKVELAKSVGQGAPTTDADFPNLSQAGDAQVVRTIAEMEREALAETEKILLEQDLSPIIDALEEASGISIYALGYSQHAAAGFCSNLRRLGRRVTFEKDESRMGTWAMSCPQDELSVLVSYSVWWRFFRGNFHHVVNRATEKSPLLPPENGIDKGDGRVDPTVGLEVVRVHEPMAVTIRPRKEPLFLGASVSSVASVSAPTSPSPLPGIAVTLSMASCPTCLSLRTRRQRVTQCVTLVMLSFPPTVSTICRAVSL